MVRQWQVKLPADEPEEFAHLVGFFDERPPFDAFVYVDRTAARATLRASIAAWLARRRGARIAPR